MDRTGVQAAVDDTLEFHRVRGYTTASAPKGVGRSYDQRQWHVGGELECLVDGGNDRAVDNGLSEAIEKVSEQRAVLCLFDCRKWRAKQTNTIALKCPSLGDLYRQIQSGLTPEGWEQTVRSLALDNSLHDLRRQGLDVDRVGDALVGHDRRRVRVDEDRAHALFAQGAARLGTRVIEFRSLPNDDGSRTENENAPDPRQCRRYHAIGSPTPARTNSKKASKRWSLSNGPGEASG